MLLPIVKPLDLHTSPSAYVLSQPHSRLNGNEVSLFIPGSQGQLEAVISSPKEKSSQNDVAIICHPHPLFGGTMTNKVVTTLARAFQTLGLHTVRFNFPGVGKSEGTYSEGVGEVEDLFAVIEWVKKNIPNQALWLAGFSFGAFVAASVATQLSVAKLILVAPPVLHFPMQSLPEIKSDTWVLQGEQDEVVPPQAVYDWVESRTPSPHLIRFPNATHFFHGQLGELRRVLEEKLV